MRALSLWQPHATFVALGIKPFETRHWSTDYRGPLAIHAAMRPMTQAEQSHFYSDAFIMKALSDRGIFGWSEHFFPRGCIVCIGDQVDCKATADGDEHAPWVMRLPVVARLCGDFRKGRFGHELRNIKRLEVPQPCLGRQKYFNVEIDPNIKLIEVPRYE